MKNRILRLAPALLAGLVVAGMSEAQPPGKKGGPPRGEGRGGPGDGFRGFGGPGGAFALERAVDDLKLSDKAKEKAEAALKEYRENVRKLTDLARSDLLLKMGEVLGPEELKTFKTALDRPPGAASPATRSSSESCRSTRTRTARSPRTSCPSACKT